MNYTAIFDWKFVVALGAASVGIISAVKMDPADAKEVSIHVIDACKEVAVAYVGHC